MSVIDLDGSKRESPTYGYNILPDVILLKIFSFLNVGDLCKAGSVCNHWYHLTRLPIFWKKVDTCDRRLTSHQVCKFVPILPPCVIYLRICSFSFQQRIPFLTPDLIIQIRKRCPQLHTLVIESAFVAKQVHFTDITIEDFPRKLSVLSLRKSFFHTDQLFCSVSQPGVPKIKVLDCSLCWCVRDYDMPFFARLPDLQEVYLAGCQITDSGVAMLFKTAVNLRILDLEGTSVGDQTIELLSERSRLLEKIFLGFTKITDNQLCLLSASVLPKLKSLCLKSTQVTRVGVHCVVTALHSLKYLYIDACSISSECAVELAYLAPMKQNFNLIFTDGVCVSNYCDHFSTRSNEDDNSN